MPMGEVGTLCDHRKLPVDCEYNRHGLETKQLPRKCRGGSQSRVFPDIVVHLRGDNDSNLLVVLSRR